MRENVFILALALPLATVLIIFAMRYVSAVLQAQARFGHDEAHRALAVSAVQSQGETAAALASIQAALTEVTARLNSVEKILKDVE